MSYKAKGILLIIINLFLISACNTSQSLQIAKDVPTQTEIPENNNTSTDVVPPLSQQKEDRIIIAVDEMDEETFIEDLDTDMLTTVAEKLQEATDEIVRKQTADPESVIRGEWVTDFRNSEQYHYVINQGVKAIKPMYYILYKSNQAGLYEYIISSAIYDIIGCDFSDNKDYQWADAFEFREKYNAYVKESISQFYSIVNDTSINQTEKIDKITNLGIFAVAPLLNELDYQNSELDKDTIYTILRKMINTSSDNEIFEDINIWREANEQYYRDIIQILAIVRLGRTK